MNKEAQDLVQIRPYHPIDANFILSTFLKGLYYGDPYIGFIPKDVFMDNYKKIATALLDSPKTVINVACLKSDPDVVLGYSILSEDFTTIHWVYVKAAWRKQGIGRAIIPQYPTATTHITELGKSLMTKYDGLIFNPFLL